MIKNLTVAFTSLVILFSLSASAAEFKAHCRDYPPELYFAGDKCAGIIPDLVTDVLAELGHSITWYKVPWIRSIEYGKKGTVDLLIRHSMTPERELFLVPIPYAHFTRELSFYKSPKFKSDVNSYDELRKLKIGAIRGHFYSPTFSTLDTRELVLVSKTPQLLKMLDIGRIDVAVSSSSHSEHLFSARFEKLDFVDSFNNYMYISIPKASDNVQYSEEIAAAILEYRKNGKIDKYYKKYGVTPPNQSFD
ncbi:transporter substrate-binding domain-containing protein [Neiella marina]|uniref:Transporter substrate-binding domain-containing protein n=1 Tax=Neiella holothuriorum TaxID=2870530 RepID=A0ABS7EIK4_9GAMM|nr:transporter substrate-binding domain-containing protein [Neiella holothuriorum]MBW8192166.1 transporter substrate-binding domain-containing protein [Neiella holothuriorum]